jgi:flagellar protein FliO/FliZ
MMKKFGLAFFILSSTLVALAQEVTEAPPVAEVAAASEKVKLAEDQIPLSIEAGKKNTDTGSTTSKALASGMIIIVLLATTYYLVRKYKTSNTINKSNMQIKVLTQHYLGPKKSLAIIHVAGESILVGITDSNISMIKSLALIDDEVPVDMPKTFSNSMIQKAAEAQTIVDELDEEFSFAGVTDTVSKKIKSMRRFS